MNDRLSVIVTVLIFAIVLSGLGWLLIRFVEPPRSSHGGGGASDAEVADLSQAINRLADQLESGVVAAPAGAGVPGAAVAHGPTQLAEGEILVVFTDQELPIDDPASPAWNAAPVTDVALQRQDQAMPMLDVATIDSISVQGLTNGRQIAWRVSWLDPYEDYHVDADRFCDAVAMQFPLTPNAAYTMGDREFQVQIIQWKALWQKDIDEHFQDVQDLHPNYWADLYWFADGEFPYRVPDAFTSPESLDYFVAYTAGNPVSELHRQQPVQELMAEGFGTLTFQPESVSVGRGLWTDGRWDVVFARPMETNDPKDYQFTPGTRDVVALAVWEGSAENVGGRKQHSQWVVFEVQR